MSESNSTKPADPAPAARRWMDRPLIHRARNIIERFYRRIRRKPRSVAEAPNLLPLLIQVLAAFSKNTEEAILEAEIDSALGFIRYDFPDAVYSELRKLFRQALSEQVDLSAMARRLAGQLSNERKIMLGIQLYDLIARAGRDRKQIADFYAFMTELGMAAQAIDVVHQLSGGDELDRSVYQQGQSPLESLSLGSDAKCDVTLSGIPAGQRIVAFRYHELVILKNESTRAIIVRGRPLASGAICRVYSGQRIIVGPQVLTFQDLYYYFNAKKNVAVTQVFLSLDDNDEVQLDKVRNRDSALLVRFGLKVRVEALRDVDALLNGVALRAGTRLEATLEDVMTFHNGSELPLADLRRRARALGGRFQLKAYKDSYLVSNNPGRLDHDDILLSPGTAGDVLLKIYCDYENLTGKLEVLEADRAIYVGELAVKGGAELKDGDIIRIAAGQVLRCDFTDRIIEEERNIISHLEVRDLAHSFNKGETALDAVTFSLSRGDLVCVMGSSGSGKSTLMRAIAGQLRPNGGAVFLNGQTLYEHLEELKNFIAYIPQDDAFDDHLTVEENMTYAAAVRAPHLSRRDRARRIESRLIELGLIERRSAVVGSPVKKRLSGGERKRLNIGLDMISPADVFLFDEPTSGLSSKDSEHVIEIIRSMAHNKIVLVTIHQPNSKLFQMFSKAVLLDKGGKMVFFGTPTEMLQYFAEAEHEQHFNAELGGCPTCGTTRPEFIFDVLETPLRDLSGDVIFEENYQGQLVPARRFSPDYWQDRYESHRLAQDMRQVNVRPQPVVPVPDAATPTARRKIRWREEWAQFRAMLRRALLSKLRNTWSLILTLAIPQTLAAIIGYVLYFTEDEGGVYDFASAFHIPTYIFIALLVALFLALMNSFDDVLRDRVLLFRERNLKLRLGYYVAAKFVTLAIFSAVQCALFVVVGNWILEIRGMFLPYFWFMFITAVSGLSLGLVISAIVNDAKTSALFVPLVLIPQLIFSGALIKYEEMNRDPDLIYAMHRWFSTDSSTTPRPLREDEKFSVPLISRFVATHYSYEALIAAQARLNPLSIREDLLQAEMDALRVINPRNETQADRLETIKDTKAMLSGIEGADVAEIEKRLRHVDQVIAGGPLDFSKLRTKKPGVSIQRIYANQKINDLVTKSENEQADYRRAVPLNVFFTPEKHYAYGKHTVTKPDGTTVTEPRLWTVSVYARNSVILLGTSAALLAALVHLLLRQLRTE